MIRDDSFAAERLFLHVIGNNIGASGCSALAGALSYLPALQDLNLFGKNACIVVFLRHDVALRHELPGIYVHTMQITA